MKKLIAVLSALLLVCFAVTASADEVIKPVVPDTLKELIGGKTFEVSIGDMLITGEDEDAKAVIGITVCEEDRFDAELIENLAEHDILYFGDGSAIVVMEISKDEYGVTVTGGFGDVYELRKREDGFYTAATEYGRPCYTELFTVKVQLPKDIRFLDQSDPENLDAPVELGYGELYDLLLENTNFSPYNTKVTFDQEGNLTELLYTYSPFN